MSISHAMIESFYYTFINKGVNYYRGYTYKFIRRNKEIRLLKKNRNLVSWFLETNEFKILNSNLSNSEKQMAEKFYELPTEAEKMYQSLKNQEKNRIKAEKEKEKALNDKFKLELNNYFSNLKDEEITYEHIEKIINFFSSRYIDQWYIVGIHPDKYNDNYPMYYSAAQSRVKVAISEIDDKRIQNLFIRSNDENKNNSVIDWAGFTDEELLNCVKVLPTYAQREGNLVTISDLQQKYFEKLVKKAIRFAENKIKSNVRIYLETGHLTINWWEKDGELFITKQEEENEPNTLMGKILQQLKPKTTNGSKPSRLHIDIITILNGQKVITTEYKTQKGIIEWKNTIEVDTDFID